MAMTEVNRRQSGNREATVDGATAGALRAACPVPHIEIR
jgi:hypothetical protein